MIFFKISHINFVQLELVSCDQYQSLARKDLKHIQAMVNLFFHFTMTTYLILHYCFYFQPMVLVVVTKTGQALLFECTLNG